MVIASISSISIVGLILHLHLLQLRFRLQFMKKLSVKRLLFIALFFYVPLQSMAWGAMGHRIVGEIAESYLTPRARYNIQKILGAESLAMASTWADFIKSDPAYKSLNPWHYVDFDGNITLQQMQAQLQKDTAVNAYNRIQFLTKELSSKSVSQEKKLMYLRLLIHIVGDVHQPLHVSKNGTSGGNDVKVEWFGNASNLHRVWDSQLLELQGLSYTEYTTSINYTTRQQRNQWQSAGLVQWLFESYQISNRIHDDIAQPNPKLSYLYDFNNVKTVNEQLLKGGVRLAGLLNDIFS